MPNHRLYADPLIDDRFGRLVVTRPPAGKRTNATMIGVRCDCGTELEVNLYSLLPGRTVSCGCARFRRGPDLSEPLTYLLIADEMAATETLRAGLGIDPTRTFQFWESVVARLTGGDTTPAACPWDVTLPFAADETIRIEVKYAQESSCAYSSGERLVFKWADLKGRRTEKPAEVIVLLGLDALDRVHAWVVPASKIRQVRSVTVTSPRTLVGAVGVHSAVAPYRCPPTQVLPEVLRAYREHLGLPR